MALIDVSYEQDQMGGYDERAASHRPQCIGLLLIILALGLQIRGEMPSEETNVRRGELYCSVSRAAIARFLLDQADSGPLPHVSLMAVSKYLVRVYIF